MRHSETGLELALGHSGTDREPAPDHSEMGLELALDRSP
jgi:hypothetical protein